MLVVVEDRKGRQCRLAMGTKGTVTGRNVDGIFEFAQRNGDNVGVDLTLKPNALFMFSGWGRRSWRLAGGGCTKLLMLLCKWGAQIFLVDLFDVGITEVGEG